MNWVLADQRRSARVPCRRRWSSLAPAELPRTTQGRPSQAAPDGRRPRCDLWTSADDSQPRRRVRRSTTRAYPSLHPDRLRPRCSIVDQSKPRRPTAESGCDTGLHPGSKSGTGFTAALAKRRPAALGYHQSKVSRLEGDRGTEDIRVLRAVPQELKIPPQQLGLSAVSDAYATDSEAGDTHRRTFLAASIAALARPPPPLLTTSSGLCCPA